MNSPATKTEAALITGATRGIGKAIADRLAKSGQMVVGIARRRTDDFPGLLRTADLADPEETRAVLADLTRTHTFTRLVCNAGFNARQPVEDIELATFDRIVSVNLRSAIQCVQAVTPDMKKAHWGRIVGIASRSMLGRPGSSVYGGIKAGLTSMCRSWALELARHGITVNVVAPGPIDTDMWRVNNPSDGPNAETIVRAIPIGRLGRPEEVATAVDYFLSHHSAFTTGQVLYVCGGLSVISSPQ